MDFVDEQDVSRLQIGQDGSQVPGALDNRAGGGAEPHAEFAGDDLGEGRFAKARRAMQEHVVERFGPAFGSLDKNT